MNTATDSIKKWKIRSSRGRNLIKNNMLCIILSKQYIRIPHEMKKKKNEEPEATYALAKLIQRPSWPIDRPSWETKSDISNPSLEKNKQRHEKKVKMLGPSGAVSEISKWTISVIYSRIMRGVAWLNRTNRKIRGLQIWFIWVLWHYLQRKCFDLIEKLAPHSMWLERHKPLRNLVISRRVHSSYFVHVELFPSFTGYYRRFIPFRTLAVRSYYL